MSEEELAFSALFKRINLAKKSMAFSQNCVMKFKRTLLLRIVSRMYAPFLNKSIHLLNCDQNLDVYICTKIFAQIASG